MQTPTVAQLALPFLITLLAGCAPMPGMPGYLNTYTSEFDGSTEITVQPAGVRGQGFAAPFLLGARWTARSPDSVIMVARIFGEYSSIDSARGLEFNIDGRILSLDSPQVFTQFDSGRGGSSRFRASDKFFRMSRADFESLLAARSVLVKLNTPRGYLEGRLIDEPNSALEGLRSFRAALP